MADTRNSGRPRPRGATKIKAHGPGYPKPHATSKSPHSSTVLPKLKLPPGNNNSHDHQNASPFSPRVREIPTMLPPGPHPPRPIAPNLRPVPPPLLDEPFSAKNAWSTPRSPGPETNSEPSSSTSALDSFFQYEGTAVQTPSRLLAIEENLLATEQLYQVDWARLRADADKFVEITGAANHHLEWVQGSLPIVASTSEQAHNALVELSRDIDSLHVHYATEKQKLVEGFDTAFARQTDERLALVDAHTAEKLSRERAHDHDVQTLTEDFQRQIQEIVTSAATLERERLDEIESLKARMADELQQQRERALVERDELERRLVCKINELRANSESEMTALQASSEKKYQELLASSQQEINDIRKSLLNEIDSLKKSSATEISELKMSSAAELDELKASSANEISILKATSAHEISQLKASSANEINDIKTFYTSEMDKLKISSSNEIERLLEASASTLADVTNKLVNELEETKQRTEREVAIMIESHRSRESELVRTSSEKIARLQSQHDNEQAHLEKKCAQQIAILKNDLGASRATHAAQLQALTARFQAELTVVKSTLTAENSVLVSTHTSVVNELQLRHTNEVGKMKEDFGMLMETLKLNHASTLQTLERETQETQDSLVQQQESQLYQLQTESKRERDRIVFRYESDLDFLRRSTAEQLEAFAKEREETIQQLRETHAARVLGLETAIRENEKRYNVQIVMLEDELDEKKRRVHELETSESYLQESNTLLIERGKEDGCRLWMRMEEMEATIAELEHIMAEKDAKLEAFKRDLRVSEDANHTKSNSLLELTFVIKSRDDEIEKLHTALLDSIQNVNSKSEILELTAETLSTKSKELEDTKAALRLESGRLSRVAEDVQHKAEMLEDSEMKIENLRLQLETLRLEMKRLQMDMRLQHEHSAGEMELKQGEIRRLHAAQTELKQKNDIHQETIVRVEASLAAATRQGDELRRRVELMKFESAQYVDDMRKLSEEILEKDKQLTNTKKEAQTLHNDKQKLHIQLNNALLFVQMQRERLERSTMLVEDIHCQYQRRIEMTAAEKDARLRHERHLLLLELNAIKDMLQQYEGVEERLTISQVQNEALETKLRVLESEKINFETRVAHLQGEIVRHEIEKKTQAEQAASEHKRQKIEIEKYEHRIHELGEQATEAEKAVKDKESLLLAISNDASSLNFILKEKEDAIVALRNELKSAQEELHQVQLALTDERQRLEQIHVEKASALDDVTSLREQLHLSETLVLEKDHKIITLEQAFQSESQAHLWDIKQAEDHQVTLDQRYCETLKELEAELAKERADKSLQAQAHEEANNQIAYLIKTLKRAEDDVSMTIRHRRETEEALIVKEKHFTESISSVLADAEHTRYREVEALKLEISELKDIHGKSVQQLEDAHQQETEALKQELDELKNSSEKSLQQLNDSLRFEIQTLTATHAEQLRQQEIAQSKEVETLIAAHAREVDQLADAKRNEAGRLRADLLTAAAEALSTAQMAHEEAATKLQADWIRRLMDVDEAHQIKFSEVERRLKGISAVADDATKRCDEARSYSANLIERVAELQRQLDEKERILIETNDVLRTRKAAIESLRKEMALMVEMHRQPVSMSETVDADSGATSPGPSMDQAILLIKQQLETFMNEDFHIESLNLTLEDEKDLVSHLKDALRVRYCLSSVGSPRLLDVGDICAAVQTLQEIIRAHEGEMIFTTETLVDNRNSIISRLRDYSVLSQTVRSLVDADDDLSSLPEVLGEYSPVFSLMKSLSVNNIEGSSTHTARVAALLATLDEHEAYRSWVQQFLEQSKLTLQCNEIHTIDDLHPFLQEVAYMRQLIEPCVVHQAKPQPIVEPDTDIVSVHQLKVLLEERQLLLLELSSILEFPEASLSRHQSVHIVDSVRDLMRVVTTFESLSSPARAETTELPLVSRAQAIIAFVEELRLITQFAQSILEEEADATATAANHSHSSSSSSLLSVHASLTRTSTPTSTMDLVHIQAQLQSSSEELTSAGDVAAVPPPVSLDEFGEDQLTLSDDALAPMDTNSRLRPTLSGALSEPLLDISLVMSDHHRILSEAAHWVNKAHSMSSKRGKMLEVSASIDFATELSQIVRDHCALLSLGKKLFRLQDPRHDLPSILECLAVIVRLSCRLRFLQPPIQASHSSDSLRSSDSDSSLSPKDKSRASISVFASLEEIARHLQDYDNFVGRMARASLEEDVVDDVEGLSTVIVERIALVDRLKTTLRMLNPAEELPQLVEEILVLVRRDREQDGTVMDIETVLKGVGKAFQDRETLRTLLERMREILPFSSSAESPDELIERLKDTLSQCEMLIRDKEQAWGLVESVTEQLATADRQRAEEDQLLAGAGGDVESNRIDRIEKLIDELKRLRESNGEMLMSIKLEEQLLSGNISVEVTEESARQCPLSNRIGSVRSLVEANKSLLQGQAVLEEKVAAAHEILEAERERERRRTDLEKTFLKERGVEWQEGESRIPLYEQFFNQLQTWNDRDEQLRMHFEQEAQYLKDHGFTLNTEEKEVTTSRLGIYKTLLNGQQVLMDEKMNREVFDQGELALLASESIPVSTREQVVPHLIEVNNLLKALEIEVLASKQREAEKETLTQKQIAEEFTFLETLGICGVDLSTPGARIGVYKTLCERAEAVKQALAVWEGSPHSDASECHRVDAQRDLDFKRLDQEHAEAMASGITAALERQAQQFASRRSVFGADESTSHSPVAPTAKTAELVEAFTKRDNKAISMIYGLIRLTTDVLNTAAFAHPGGKGEIPVDLSQAVMACVKELKGLKEYLLQTLEEITRDSGAFVVAQPSLAVTRESVMEREVAIDYALLLHRDFAARMNQTLDGTFSIVCSTVHTLRETLASHAGDFSETEAKWMASELRAAEAAASKQVIEAKFGTQEEFLKRFSDERKRVETALLDALDEAKKERAQLQVKIESLEAERNEAVAQANAHAAALASAAASTPRTPLTASSRGPMAVVPTRPDKPRELTASRLKGSMQLAAGAAHKERFVSDLERETGQRRTVNGMGSISARRAHEWKRHELLSSSSQIEQQFRAMSESQPHILAVLSDSYAPHPSDRAAASLADQELWYQGVRLLQHVSFFVSVFFVPRQKTFRVEVFNSDSEQQQTIYVTLDEMQLFVRESRRASKLGLTLDDPSRHSEIVDVLFERVKILGDDSSNLLFAFQ